MRCQSCGLALDSKDNYCRRCGAPVQVVEVAATVREMTAAAPQRAVVVRSGAAMPAIISAAARPIAAGAAAVAASALMRFAVRRAAGALLGESLGRQAGLARVLPRRGDTGDGTVQVTEVYLYRRVTRP